MESAQYIAQLVKENPVPDDDVGQGDDHLNLIKKVLKQNFPGSGGNGFSKAITTSEDELNRVDGVLSPIQDQFNAIPDDYVAKDNGDQTIEHKLTVKQRLSVVVDGSDLVDGLGMFGPAGEFYGSFHYNEDQDSIHIAQQGAAVPGRLETDITIRDGLLQVIDLTNGSPGIVPVPTFKSHLANKQYVDDNSGGYPVEIPYPTPGNNYQYAEVPTRMQVANEVSVVATLNAPNEFSGFTLYTPDPFNFNKPVIHGAFAYDDNLDTVSIYQGAGASANTSDTVAEFKDGNIRVWSGTGKNTNPTEPLHLVNLQYLQANYGSVAVASGTAGASGTFEDNTGKTITVLNGIITDLG